MMSHRAIISLKTKTEILETALFYNFSNAVLKFPVTVIHLSKFDKEGNLWFLLKKPYKEISGMDSLFPAQMNFYKKACPFYERLEGTATIAGEEKNEMVLIKFRISKAHCFHRKSQIESTLVPKTAIIPNALQSFYEFISCFTGYFTRHKQPKYL